MSGERACPLCGGRDAAFLFRARDRMHPLPGEWPVVRCRACSLVFLADPPAGEDLARHYPPTYYAYAKPEPPEDARAARRAATWRALYRARFDPTFRSPWRPLLALWKRADVRGLPGLRPGARLLDVGCGDGSFLAFARTLGLETVGVEPSPEGAARARARGLDVRTGTLEDAKLPDASFDVVAFNHVFEHVEDPHATLAEARRVLADDGTIVLAVPNADSLAFRLFGARWVQLDAPRHLATWSPRTLGRLARRHGLDVARVRHVSGPFQIAGSLRVWRNETRARPKGLAEPGLARSRAVDLALRPVAAALDGLELGDTVEVWLRVSSGSRSR